MIANWKVGIIIPISQIWRLRLAYSHGTSRWWSQDLNPDLSDLQTWEFSTLWCCLKKMVLLYNPQRKSPGCRHRLMMVSRHIQPPGYRKSQGIPVQCWGTVWPHKHRAFSPLTFIASTFFFQVEWIILGWQIVDLSSVFLAPSEFLTMLSHSLAGHCQCCGSWDCWWGPNSLVS